MDKQHPFALALHGGAGTITRASLTLEQDHQYRQALEQALHTGYQILKQGGDALQAVEATVVVLEDCPLFNAGRGSVFNKQGKHEMDAAIMCGKTLAAGAVTGVRNVRNPIQLANQVLHHSDHVFLCQHGAEEFARNHGIAFEPDAYFFTQQRHDQWLALRDSDTYMLDHSETREKKFGTVGAVALDVHGNLAAATSTGGMTNKNFNRIGDSPIIGAGTYANNRTCAVSCTGHGEFFMRYVVAYDISCLMEYKGLSLANASALVVHKKLKEHGGEGGLVAVSATGEIALPFNSEGMYRGAWVAGKEPEVAIYQE
ncbi:isoaspartyl peptidase/L-asparaginase family protein [Rufibacter glacialis]|uniref:Isoaspartyl peptidase n=1 Tax=Rufibacter glacialis TaxID=1259555 RepID=A0A5M8QHK5_9BACT|nr:isoaspartyl peptidase/L-asparaginase [Rufibacter glacialis]KAA6434410.1 isoaspartyl peptidase/L-asparaginase [Rufibacter glacialis]GGK69299.1 L-asparaginase [Rufibacter glacialis]